MSGKIAKVWYINLLLRCKDIRMGTICDMIIAHLRSSNRVYPPTKTKCTKKCTQCALYMTSQVEIQSL